MTCCCSACGSGIILAGSLVVAEVVHRLVEKPMIRVGRRRAATYGRPPEDASEPRARSVVPA